MEVSSEAGLGWCLKHGELQAQPGCVGCSGGALESLKRDSDKVIQVIRI